MNIRVLAKQIVADRFGVMNDIKEMIETHGFKEVVQGLYYAMDINDPIQKKLSLPLHQFIKNIPDLAKAAGTAPIVVGDKVLFHGGRKVYDVASIDQWGKLNLTYNGKMAPHGVSPSDVRKVGDTSEVVDKEGKSAYSVAKDLFNGKYAVTDFYNTTSESLAEIKSVQSDGSVIVQEFNGVGQWKDQEHFMPATAQRGDVIKFKPKMYSGEWTWWGTGDKKHLTLEPYKGGFLTRLLD